MAPNIDLNALPMEANHVLYPSIDWSSLDFDVVFTPLYPLDEVEALYPIEGSLPTDLVLRHPLEQIAAFPQAQAQAQAQAQQYSPPLVNPFQENSSQQVQAHNPIVVDSEDEVVILTSSREFPRAREQSGRSSMGTFFNDLMMLQPDSLSSMDVASLFSSILNDSYQGIPSSQPATNPSNVRNVEGGRNRMGRRRKEEEGHKEPNLESADPEESGFQCPVCLHSLVRASSTICGHIFCDECIRKSIKINKQCPTCRRKLRMNNFHRVYFPASNS